ncbi:hypothetical protein D9M70_462870 [compost metagenome]
MVSLPSVDRLAFRPSLAALEFNCCARFSVEVTPTKLTSAAFSPLPTLMVKSADWPAAAFTSAVNTVRAVAVRPGSAPLNLPARVLALSSAATCTEVETPPPTTDRFRSVKAALASATTLAVRVDRLAAVGKPLVAAALVLLPVW